MLHVLYVDDEPSLLEIGKIFLERGGEFFVDTITSAPAALDLMQSADYDAIISDYLMPEMDGIEFLKRVRNSGDCIPFIIFSGRGREEIVIQALNGGADYYLQKGGEPLSQFTELAYKVRQAVQRRKAEASIRDHERREQDIINFLPDATVAIDRDGTVIAWNRAMEEMTGIPASDMLGKGDHEYALPFYGGRVPILIDLIFAPPDEIRERYSNVVRDGAMLAAETALPRLRGEPRTLWGRASPLYDQSGEIVGAIESIRDITERGKAETALRKSEALHRSLFLASPDGIAVTDARGTIINASPRALELFGLAGLEDVIGSNVVDWIAPEDRNCAREALENVFSGAASPGFREFQVHKKDGTGFLASINSSIIRGNDGESAGLVSILRNVTQSMEIQENLRENEEKYRTMFDNQNNGLMIIDASDHRITDVNPHFCNLVGLAKEQIIGEICHKFVCPAEKGKCPITDLGRPVDNEQRVLLAGDGRKIPVLKTVSWIKRGGKKFLIENLQDITKLIEAEAALRESERKYRAFFSTSRDFVFITSKDGAILDFNEAAVEAAGYRNKEELFQARLTDLYANPGDREVFIRDICRQGFLKDYPVDLKKKDGSIVHTLLSAVVLSDGTGNVSGFQGIIHDVTERERIEEDLRSAQKQLTETYRLAHIGVWEWSRDTDILTWSDELHRMTGWDPALPVPPFTALEHYFTPEGWISLKRAVHQAATKGSPFNLELEVIRQHHSRMWIQVFGGSKCNGKGMVVQLHGTVQDITERHMMEESIRESNRKLNLLSGITRHDIQNQLLSVRGYLALAQEHTCDPRVAGYLEKEEKILETIERQIAFTRDYQDMGIRSTSWQNINEIVLHAALQLPMRNNQIRVDRPDLEILADPLLEKVFYNLIDNALRYGGDRMTCIRVSSKETENGLTLICEDDGNGISLEDKRKLFTKGFGKNTGFGLFLSREILSITGITITETGIPGKGARFELSLPKEKYRFGRSSP